MSILTDQQIQNLIEENEQLKRLVAAYRRKIDLIRDEHCNDMGIKCSEIKFLKESLEAEKTKNLEG